MNQHLSSISYGSCTNKKTASTVPGETFFSNRLDLLPERDRIEDRVAGQIVGNKAFQQWLKHLQPEHILGQVCACSIRRIELVVT